MSRYEVKEDAAGVVYIMRDGEYTDASSGGSDNRDAMQYLVNLLNTPSIQTQVVCAMRADQERREAIISDIFPHKVLGIACPAWIADWPDGRQTKYAIDNAGYNQWRT